MRVLSEVGADLVIQEEGGVDSVEVVRVVSGVGADLVIQEEG